MWGNSSDSDEFQTTGGLSPVGRASIIGEITSNIEVRGESPYRDEALTAARYMQTMLGDSSIDVSNPADFDKGDLRIQRRATVPSMLGLTKEDYGARIKAYVEESSVRSYWSAATGVGKSTLFPMELARLSRKLVLVVEPTMMLAMSACAYMGVKHPDRTVLVPSAKKIGTVKAVGYTTAGVLLSILVNDRVALSEVGFLYIDECHDPSGEYFALTGVLAEYRDGPRIIFASATLDGTTYHSSDTRFMVEHRTASVASSEAVVGAGPGEFWHYKTVKDRLLIICADPSACQKISAWYKKNGVRVSVLTESTTAEEYRDIVLELKAAADNPPYVLCSTAMIETGITLPLDSVLDLRTKRVISPKIAERMMIWEYRFVTQAEAAQRAGRVGRMKGGRYYGPEIDFHEFPEGIDDTHKLRAYLWIKLLGFKPLEDLFVREAQYLEPITQMGCAQLLNLTLHPLLSRVYMDDKGRIFKNFVKGLQTFAYPGRKVGASDVSLDPVTADGWFQHRVSTPNLNGGKTLELYLPLDPASVCLHEMLHIAFEELKWRFSRPPSEADDVVPRRRPVYTEPPAVKQGRFRESVVVPEIPLTEIVPRQQKLKEAPLVRFQHTPMRRHVRYSSEAGPSTQIVRYREPRQNYEEPSFEPILNEWRIETPPRKKRAPYFRDLNLARPVRPYNVDKDFGTVHPTDEGEIARLIEDGIERLSKSTDTQRQRLFDSFCCVWNYTAVSLNRVRDDLYTYRGAGWRSARRVTSAQLEREAAKLEDRVSDLETLETAFRRYMFFGCELTYTDRCADHLRDDMLRYNPISQEVSLPEGAVCQVVSANGRYGQGFYVGSWFLTAFHVSLGLPIRIMDGNITLHNPIRHPHLDLVKFRVYETDGLPCVPAGPGRVHVIRQLELRTRNRVVFASGPFYTLTNGGLTTMSCSSEPGDSGAPVVRIQEDGYVLAVGMLLRGHMSVTVMIPFDARLIAWIDEGVDWESTFDMSRLGSR